MIFGRTTLASVIDNAMEAWRVNDECLARSSERGPSCAEYVADTILLDVIPAAHPADLLESNAAPSRPEESFSDTEFTDRAYNWGVSDAADFLREYERQHGVRFMAVRTGR